MADETNKSAESAREQVDALKDTLNIRSKLNQEEQYSLDLAKQTARTLERQSQGLDSSRRLSEQIKSKFKEKNKLLETQTKLTDQIKKASKEQQDKVLQNLGTQKTLSAEIDKQEKIISELLSREETLTAEQQQKLKGAQQLVGEQYSQLDALKEQLTKEDQILASQYQLVDATNKEISAREKDLETLNQIKSSMGAIAKISGALGELPVVGGLFKNSLQEAEAEMVKIAEETGKVPSKLDAARIQFKAFEKNALAAAMAGIVKNALEVDKSMNNVQRSTGMSEMQVAGLNYELQGASVASGNMYVTSVDMLKTFGEITKQIGMSAEALGAQAVVEATALKDQMGLSAEAAGGFAGQARISGKNVKEAGEEIFDVVNKSNKLNKTMYSGSEILAEVGNVSAEIGAQFGFNTEALAEAAIQAKRLGMNMSDLNSIASKLVDFESSISAELEAELLTGQQLNLEKARELALTNDLAGLGKELEKQGITAEKYSKMNRIQQEAQAKALGMSSEQMGKMLMQQEYAKLGAEEFTEKYGEQNYEAAKQVDVQKKLEAALTKIADAVAPILTFFANLLSNSLVLYSVLGVMLFSKVKGIAKSFGTMRDNLKESYKFAKDLVKSGINKITGKGASFADKRQMVLDRQKSLADKAAANTDKAKGATKGAKGAGPGGFLESLGNGLASMGNQMGKIMQGALALGFTVAVMGASFAFAMQVIKDVDPVQMIAFSGSLTALGLTVAFMGKVGKDIMKGALAMVVMAGGLIPAAYAFSLLAGVDASSIIAFSVALPLLALALAGLGTLFMGPQLIAFGLGIAMIAALGLAIIPAAMAFNLLKDADIESILSQMIQFGSVAPQLMMLGGSLVAIAAGLSLMAGAGLLALPIIGALTALGLVAPALESIAGIFFGGGGEEGEDETMEILIEIRDAIKSGGKVYLDGNEVGKTLKLGTYKT